MGIFRVKEVWATNINHLNDASEIRHAMSLLLAEVESRLKEAGTDLEYRRIWEAYLEEWTGSQPKSDSGVVSFSTNGNQLSQWRAYCPRGNGYSIGFSPADLSYARKAANAFLVKCIYDPAEQRELICAVADYMALSRRRSERFDWVAQLGFLGSTSRKVLAAMLAIKNGGFEEEGEWRLVVEGVKDTPQRFRSGRFGVLPYYAVPLCSQSQSVPFAEVFMGPQAEPDVAERALCLFLGTEVNAATLSGRIKRSGIPYRY
jgi:hypothetical protein